MIRILRTIAIIDVVSITVFAGIGALFGMTPFQTLGAGVIGFGSIGLVLGWRAIVNAPQVSRPRQSWTHPTNDPVAPPLPPPPPVYRIESPQPLMIEAPRKEISVFVAENGTLRLMHSHHSPPHWRKHETIDGEGQMVPITPRRIDRWTTP